MPWNNPRSKTGKGDFSRRYGLGDVIFAMRAGHKARFVGRRSKIDTLVEHGMKKLIETRRFVLLAIGAIALMLLGNSMAHGHATNESYIWLNPQKDRFDGRIEFRLEDLRKYFNMDIPTEYAPARATIIEHQAELKKYARTNFELKTIDNQIIKYKILKVDLLENDYFGHFAQLFFETETMEVPSDVLVTCSFLFEHDKYSRCLLDCFSLLQCCLPKRFATME